MSQLKTGALLSYCNVAVSAVSALVLTPWIVRVLGIDQYGLYTLALTVISLFAIDFGLGEATARFLSKYKAEHDEYSARVFANLVVRLYWAIDGLLAVGLLVFYFLLPFVYRGLSESDLETFRSVFFIVSLYTLVTFPFIPLDGVLISSERFGILKGIELGQKAITLVTMMVLLSTNASLSALIVGNVTVGLVSVIVKIACSYSYLPPRPWPKQGRKALLRSLVRFTFWLGLTGLLNRLVMGLTPTLLAFSTNAEEVGVFGAAAAIEGYVYVIGSAMSGLFLPRITRIMHSEDAQNTVGKLMAVFGRFQLALVGTIYVGFLIFGQEFVQLWLNREPNAIYWSVVILVAPSIVLIPLQLGRTALVAIGHLQPQTMVYGVSALVAIVVTLVMAPHYGAIGGATGVASAYVVRAAGLSVVYQKEIGIDIRRFYSACFPRLTLTLVVIGAIADLTNRFVPLPGGWGTFGIKIALFTLVAMIVIYRIGLSAADRRLLLTFLPIGRRK